VFTYKDNLHSIYAIYPCKSTFCVFKSVQCRLSLVCHYNKQCTYSYTYQLNL